jgi:hypothetical protein
MIMKIEIKHRVTNTVLWSGESESFKAGVIAAAKCGANLSGAYLSGAYLSGAYLSGAKGYSQNHEIFSQLTRNNIVKFSISEQETVFRIVGLRLCWDSIAKEYGKKIGPIFGKLKKLGWGEYADYWKKFISESIVGIEEEPTVKAQTCWYCRLYCGPLRPCPYLSSCHWQPKQLPATNEKSV